MNASTQNRAAKFAHFGDPCIFCGVGHNEIAPGQCPANDGALRIAGYVSLEVRYDGVARYRYRTTDGKVHERYSHVSNHLPYYHFGLSDDLIADPPYDRSLRGAVVTA